MPRPAGPPADTQTLDLFLGEQTPCPPTVRRVMDAAAAITQDPPERADFLHAVLCQVGMPRKRTEGRTFERRSGSASMLLEAGRIWQRGSWKEQPLPYGTKPRLVMVHISGEAVRRQSRQVEIGESMRDFLTRLGIDTSGGAHGGYTMFKRQMEALAACRLSLGMSVASRDVTINTQPISRFEAWFQHDGAQQALWPGVLELSPEFFDTLVHHAVPLDHRALGALKHSALALDVYSWLAHRLCRVRKVDGVKVSWANLKEQFGQEYADPKDFKKKLRIALRQVLAVYPDAKVESAIGGIVLKPSLPPVARTQVLVG
jgi:hypothetical protein